MRCWLGLLLFLNACGSCSKNDASSLAPDAALASGDARVATAEVLPRCRGEAQRLDLGEGTVVGNVAVGADGLLVGLVRTAGGKRTAAVLRASLDLATQKTIELGAAFGDDPPPSPRWNGTTAYASWLERPTRDGGPRIRTLKVARLTDDRVGLESQIEQQADESTVFDVAWSDGRGLAAWDEDAPNKPDAALPSISDRGYVKVQGLGGPESKPRVASPETSDADSPQLVSRPGGYWLAWLARRVEEAPSGVEGPGEDKDFRWVEAVMLDARGEPQGPVRRVSSERGRAVAFDMARNGADLVVLVQDEAAAAEGGGARLLRYVVGGPIVPPTDLVDGGVGHALAEVVAAPEGTPAHWLAWSDVAEHAHLTALGNGLVPSGPAAASLEPAFDGARVLAETTDPKAGLYVLVSGEKADKPEIRRFACR